MAADEFKDGMGRAWSLRITVGTIRRVRDLLGVDLLKILDGKAELLQRMSEDPVLLVDTIAAICRPQMEARGVDDDQFAEGLTGDAIDHATTAMIMAIGDFLPEKKRAPVVALWEKVQATDALLTERLVNAVNQASPEALLSGGSSTSTPGSPGSPQTPTPSGN